MTRTLRLLALGALTLLATASDAQIGNAQADTKPPALVLHLPDSLPESTRAATRAAIAAELALPVTQSGLSDAASLTVSTENDHVEVTYREPRKVLTRKVTITAEDDLPTLLAELAGNLVRDEAALLIAELTPEPAPSSMPTEPAPADEATPCPAAEAPTLVREIIRETAPRYLDQDYVLSLLLGGELSGDEQIQFTLQVSRRFGPLDVGLSARLAYGRVDADVSGPDAGQTRVSAYQVTIPVSLEYRVVSGDSAYLQLGGYAGLRLAGFMNKQESVTSGSDGDLSAGLQATAGFALADQHGLVLRLAWEIAPLEHIVSNAPNIYRIEPLRAVAQVGWQIGF